MYFGVIMLLIIVTVLSAASLQGVMKFRKLTKSIRERSLELPQAADLGLSVSALRSTLWQVSHPASQIGNNDYQSCLQDKRASRFELTMKIQEVEQALENYQLQLETSEIVDPTIAEADTRPRVAGLVRGVAGVDRVMKERDAALTPQPLAHEHGRVDRGGQDRCGHHLGEVVERSEFLGVDLKVDLEAGVRRLEHDVVMGQVELILALDQDVEIRVPLLLSNK